MIMTGFMSVLQGSSVAVLPQGSTPATFRGVVRASGGLGAPRGTTRTPVPPQLTAVPVARKRMKDQLGLQRAFRA